MIVCKILKKILLNWQTDADKMTPRLKKIDLSKIVECDHPDIKVGKNYLAKIYGEMHAGKFSRQWYGLNFEAVYDAGIQLNSKGWQRLYEIVEKGERGGKDKK